MPPPVDEESKSYSAVFLIAVGLLLLGSLWSVWDDNISRRPWKKYQAAFFDMEIEHVKAELAAEEKRLSEDPKYVQTVENLEEALGEISNGERAKVLAELERDLARAKVREYEWDLQFRIVKSEIEEARYEYEHAAQVGRSGKPEREHLERKESQKGEIEKRYHSAQSDRREIEEKIKAQHARVKALEDELHALTSERDRLAQKLDGLTINVGLGFATLRFPRVPKIEQVVLEEFDRNAYDQPVARVDRCVSCHAGIDKEGFEDAPNPYRTHPDRELLLGSHPPEKFACTPCHEGQGAAVNSIAMAHGEVIFWEKPLLRGERVQASCIGCHDDVRRTSGADTVASGEQLFEQLGCHGCHLVEGYDGLGRVGPSLRSLAAKNGPEWMVSWIENPHEFSPRTKMPWFLLDREQSIQASAFLLKASNQDAAQWLDSHPDPAGIDPDDPSLVARGKNLVDSVGCRGCHSFAPEEVASPLGETKSAAPSLARVAEKTNARWIYHWIRDPRSYNPETRMPSLRLSHEEAAAITSYLMTLREKSPGEGAGDEGDLHARIAEPDTIAAGEKVVRKYGCYACHDIPGMESESRIGVELSFFGSKDLEELFFADRKEIQRDWEHWTYYKLKDPRIYETEFIEQMMPNFRLGDSEIRALRVFLASRVEHSPPAGYRVSDPEGFAGNRVRGRRLVDDYNCRGCHVIDEVGGDIAAHYERTPELAPPNLRGQGRKVQANWLFGFMKNPVPIRPWLEVRMPTFGLSDEEARTLVEYFRALEEVKNPYVFLNVEGVPEKHIEAAAILVSKEYFDCFSCHQQGDKKPEGPPEGWAPDLAMARERLDPNWIFDWIKDPQALMPGTKMPAYYPGGPDDVFEGDEDRQIEAMRDYLMILGTPRARLVRTATNEGSPS